MMLAGKTVQFWLSDAGKKELPSQVFVSRQIEALVVDEDQIGVWVWIQRDAESEPVPQVTLLKWEHFATAVTTYEVPSTPERPLTGFRPS